jgi:hypothetical protein
MARPAYNVSRYAPSVPVRHRALTFVWALLFGSFAIGLAMELSALVVIPLLAAMPSAFFTYRAVERTADLGYRWLYYALVGSLLLSAAATAVGAGMTIVIEPSGGMPIVGFLALGTTNVIVAILAWRALVRPSTRAAARAGMYAVLLELLAMTIDVVMTMHKNGTTFGDRELGFSIALVGATISLGTGALACFASLVTFVPDQPDVPEARVVAKS